MKKLYTIVWLLMTSLVLSAAEISQEQALENARSFMLQKSVGRQAKDAFGEDEVLMNKMKTAFRAYCSNRELQAQCVQIFKSLYPSVTDTDENIRKDLLFCFFENYYNRMSYVPFKKWEDMIPVEGDLAQNVTNWVSDLLTDDEKQSLVRYKDPSYYGVKYDGGKFITDFFEGMKQSTCHMMFVYGMQDPWTDGQIPNDKMGENSRKLFIQHPTDHRSDAGLHNDYIDQWNFSERAELFKWLNQLGFLANE